MSIPEQLVDYLAGALAPEAAEAFEADLLSGRYDGAELQWLGSVVLGLRSAAIAGTLTIGISEAELVRLQRAGFVINIQALAPGGVTDIDFGPDFDLVVMRVPIALRPGERLDAEQLDPTGAIVRRVEGLPLAPESGELLMCCHRELVATILRGQGTVRSRYIAVGAAGERLLHNCDLRAINLR